MHLSYRMSYMMSELCNSRFFLFFISFLNFRVTLLGNFNKYKISELSNSVFFSLIFFILKFPSYEKLAIASQFD